MNAEPKREKNWRTRHIDLPLGARIIELRDTRGVSRKQLAKRLEISLSQMQHLEEGDSRLSAAQLWQICSILDLDVSEIFAGLPTHVVDECGGSVATDRPIAGVAEDAAVWAGPVPTRPDVLALSKAAARLSPGQVEPFIEILKALKPKRS